MRQHLERARARSCESEEGGGCGEGGRRGKHSQGGARGGSDEREISRRADSSQSVNVCRNLNRSEEAGGGSDVGARETAGEGAARERCSGVHRHR